jgi:hypothetical protein
MLEDLIIVILGAAYGVCAFFLGFLYGRLYERKRLTGPSSESVALIVERPERPQYREAPQMHAARRGVAEQSKARHAEKRARPREIRGD